MLFRSKLLRTCVALTLVLSMSLITFADTIRLKNGSVIKGKIINFGNVNLRLFLAKARDNVK